VIEHSSERQRHKGTVPMDDEKSWGEEGRFSFDLLRGRCERTRIKSKRQVLGTEIRGVLHHPSNAAAGN